MMHRYHYGMRYVNECLRCGDTFSSFFLDFFSFSVSGWLDWYTHTHRNRNHAYFCFVANHAHKHRNMNAHTCNVNMKLPFIHSTFVWILYIRTLHVYMTRRDMLTHFNMYSTGRERMFDTFILCSPFKCLIFLTYEFSIFLFIILLLKCMACRTWVGAIMNENAPVKSIHCEVRLNWHVTLCCFYTWIRMIV